MCGIVGYIGKKDKATNFLLECLSMLEYRGYDSAGIAFLENDKINIIKEKGKIINLKEIVCNDHSSNIGIGHTRWATHGKPNQINAHPHKVGKITLVHNGIIENYHELKEELQKEGYTFQSETDSEVATALIDKLYNEEEDLLKALSKASTILKGSYAFAIMLENDFNTLYALRKDSPLIVGLGTEENYVASDVPAILDYTRKYYLLDDFDVAVLKADQVKIYNNGKEVKKSTNEFKYDLSTARKNNFEHFMIKEIYEQPKLIKDNLRRFFIDEEIKLDELPDFSKYSEIEIIGCGSAYHTGLIGEKLIEEYGNIPTTCYIASEYRYQKNFFHKNKLVIVISQSGETADTLASLRLAKENNVDTLAIVNVVGSSIAREAKFVIYIGAGPEIAVATTKAFSLQLLILSMIALKLGLAKKTITDTTEIYNDFQKLPKKLETILGMHQELKDIAKVIYERENAFFIGRGVDYPLAMEGALKLKEISYIHAESYAAGELKHGTISLIDTNVPVFGIITDFYLAEKTASNLKEVKARDSMNILLLSNNIKVDSNIYDYLISIPHSSKLSTPLIAILPLQILSYEIAKLRGCDIDKPKNLAKSVTVE